MDFSFDHWTIPIILGMISSIAIFLCPVFLYRPFYVDRARKELYSTLKSPSITLPVILFLFNIDWNSTSMPPIVFPSQKFRTGLETLIIVHLHSSHYS